MTITPNPAAKCDRLQLDLSLLDTPSETRAGITHEELERTSRIIEEKLKQWQIEAHVERVVMGPTVTTYVIQLAPGEEPQRLEEMKLDLARALDASSKLRLALVGSGANCMGVEVPNKPEERQFVCMKEVIGSRAFQESVSLLTLALGKDLSGKPIVADLEKLPHLLVSGTMGAGKTEALEAMIVSLLFKNDLSQMKLVLIDTKQTKFSQYNRVPYMLCPVVNDVPKAVNALNWLVREMERRYELMSQQGVCDIGAFNVKALKAMPAIVCVIDEVADLLVIRRKPVESALVRLAQKGGAAGIHLILATQVPGVDVITPQIKANIPARLCLQVTSRFDSFVVLDECGAQDLLRNGDMLFRRARDERLVRIQGCFVSTAERICVATTLQTAGGPNYEAGVTEGTEEVEEFVADKPDGDVSTGGKAQEAPTDPLYDQAVELVVTTRRPSASFVQRKFGIGYNRAWQLLEVMERAGIVSQPNAAGKREVLTGL